MCMLVRVDVRNVDANCLDLSDLCGSLRANLFRIDAPSKRTRRERFQSIAENTRQCEGRNCRRFEYRPSINQNDMATDAKIRDCPGLAHRLRKSIAVGH